MQRLTSISQEKTAFIPTTSFGFNLAKRVASAGSRIRKAERAAKGVRRMTSAGGETAQEALNIAKKTHGSLAEVNRELLGKDVGKWNVAGRIKRRGQLKKTQKLMTSLEKSKAVAAPIEPTKKIKPMVSKKNLLIGGSILGAGAIGGQAIGTKGRQTQSQYNRYYQ